MKKIKISKNERAEVKRQNIAVSQSGSGLFLFQNKNKDATLQLPKQSFDNKKWVGPNETWQGDSFFLKMIPKEAILVKTIISPDEQKKQEQIKKEEGKMLNENKLILDQPDQITTDGRVEHLVPSDEESINENENKNKKKKVKSESKSNKDKLLTEDPIAGVIIID